MEEGETWRFSVHALKAAVGNASGLIIASPEYAHGISGPMKNALDWLVSGVEFPYKPIMLCNTSPRASHAMSALTEVLNTMSGVIIDKAATSVPLLGRELDSEGILADDELSQVLTCQLGIFCNEVNKIYV
jgi:NAD(P)H-dependent FMN reductase